MENKQTAVEWLYDQIDNKGKCIYEVIEQAKAMEKEQLYLEYERGYNESWYNTTPEPITMIDPPSGWKYGFPKPIPKDRFKDVYTWLVEQGYPKSEIDALGEDFYCRYWEE